MIYISYPSLLTAITVMWLLVRGAVWIKNKRISLRRELELLTVYGCIVVVARFTCFPFDKVNGSLPPLIFDPSRLIPPNTNLIPLVYLCDYDQLGVILLNVGGNIAMFIPIGIVWPVAFRELDNWKKALAAGAGFSLFIEIFQLLFYERVTDTDDLLMNSLGFIIGYGIYSLARIVVKKMKNTRKRQMERTLRL